jgi:ubiquinone/menaquinone biosynthesis C-methylase UbiE
MKTTQYYTDLVAELYDLDPWYAHYNHTENAKGITEILGDTTNQSLLELASGTGSYLFRFAPHYKKV